MPSCISTRKKSAGFTLIEVMVTMFLISMMCLGVFSGLQQITKAMTAVALRNEAYHLMQAEAERLLSADFSNFVASTSDQTIASDFKTSYAPSAAAALTLGSDNGVGRINFTRRVVAVASTTTSTTLRVDVLWTWDGRANTVSAPLFRTK